MSKDQPEYRGPKCPATKDGKHFAEKGDVCYCCGYRILPPPYVAPWSWTLR